MAAAAQAWTAPAGLPRPVVVCVDDELAVLQTLERQLYRLLQPDYVVELAQTSEEALELVADLDREQFRLALLITDLHMPGMRGDVLMARLRLQFPSVPQILLTGQADLREGCPPGIDVCLAKPWEAERLAEVLRAMLGEKALQEE